MGAMIAFECFPKGAGILLIHVISTGSSFHYSHGVIRRPAVQT